MQANHPECDLEDGCFNKNGAIGWAIAVVTICAMINVGTRQFAITLNNLFAIAKVLFLVCVTFLGIIWGSLQKENQCRQISWDIRKENFKPNSGDIVLAVLYAAYPYTGFEQPFYVLAEVKNPRRVFPRATITAMLIALVLFPLANVGYLCVTPYTGGKPENTMIIAMFERISGTSSDGNQNDADHRVVRAISALLAVSIFGNIMAQTFTASRVKQEIAKEGILPFSLSFASGSDSVLSQLFKPRHTPPQTRFTVDDVEVHPEQVPIAATFLHWTIEVVFILAFGLPLGPVRAYRILAAIKTATLVGILGLFTAAGLLYLKIDAWLYRKTEKGRQWATHVQWLPLLSPLHAIVATGGMALIVFGTFAEPTVKLKNVSHLIGPSTAWAAVAIAVLWWAWLMLDQRRRRDFIHVVRRPFIEKDGPDGELVLKAEIVVLERIPARARKQISSGVLHALP